MSIDAESSIAAEAEAFNSSESKNARFNNKRSSRSRRRAGGGGNTEENESKPKPKVLKSLEDLGSAFDGTPEDQTQDTPAPERRRRNRRDAQPNTAIDPAQPEIPTPEPNNPPPAPEIPAAVPIAETPATTEPAAGAEPETNSQPENSPSPESDAFPEKPTREAVLLAFESAYQLYDSYPEDKLTNEQKAAKDLLREIKGKTLDHGRMSYLNTFHATDGTTFRQREYIPTDSIIAFLDDRIESGELTPAQAEEYKKMSETLYTSSVPYDRGAGKKLPERKFARLSQEQQRIASDTRIAARSNRGNFLKAEDSLFARRELIIPPQRKPGDPPPPDIDPPLPQPINPPDDSKDIDKNSDRLILDETYDQPFEQEIKTPADKARELYESKRENKIVSFVTREEQQILKDYGISQEGKRPNEILYELRDKLEAEDKKTVEKSEESPSENGPTKPSVGREATWHAPEYDNDVKIIGEPEIGPDGKEYIKVFNNNTASEDKVLLEDVELKEDQQVDKEPDNQEAQLTPDNPPVNEDLNYIGHKGKWQDRDIKTAGNPTLHSDGKYYIEVEIEGQKEKVPYDEIKFDQAWTNYQGRWKGQDIKVVGEPTFHDDNKYYVEIETPEGKRSVPISEIGAKITVTPLEEVRREASFIDRTQAAFRMADMAARERLNEEARRPIGLSLLAWARKAKIRVAEDYYLQKWRAEYMDQMIEANNSFLEFDLATGAASEANRNIAYEREAGFAKISTLNSGEIHEGQAIVSATGELKDKIMDSIIYPVVYGQMDESQLQKAMTQFVEDNKEDSIIAEFFGPNNKHNLKAEYFATDVFEMAMQLKNDYQAHGYALDRLSDLASYVQRNAVINFGKTTWAHETEVDFNAADRFVAWAREKEWRGRILNPATIGALTTIGLYAGRNVLGRAATVAGGAVPVVGGLLAGGAFAALRRNHDLKVDYATERIDESYNLAPEGAAPRREELAPRDMASVAALLGRKLDGSEDDRNEIAGDGRGLRVLLTEPLTGDAPTVEENRLAVVRRIAEINARIDLSKELDLDMIKSGGKYIKEQGLNGLTQAVVEARLQLKAAGMDEEEMNAAEKRFTGSWKSYLIKSRDQQEKDFNNYNLKESGKAGVVAILAGGIVGGAGKAGLTVVSRATGIDLSPGNFLHRGKDMTGDLRNAVHHGGNVNAGDYHIQMGNPQINPDHTAFITDNKGVVIADRGITVGENGHITFLNGDDTRNADAISRLQQRGFGVNNMYDTRNTIVHAGTGVNMEHIGPNEIKIPAGTKLVNNNGHYNLVAAADNRVLASNITLDQNGAHYNGDLIKIDAKGGQVNTADVWNKNTTNITRQWYGQNTTISDGNEIAPINSAYTTPDGKRGITIDLNRFKGQSFQTGNNPYTIDVPRAMSEGKLGIFWSTPDNPQNGVWTPVDSSGRINFDPTITSHLNNNPASMTNAQFSQTVINGEALGQIKDGPLGTEFMSRQNVLNLANGGKAGTWEVGIMDGNKLNVLATGHGTGNMPSTIGGPNTYTVSIPKDITDTVRTVEMTPTDVNKYGAPFVPFPFVGRYPLERNRNVETPPPSATPTETIPPAVSPQQEATERNESATDLGNDASNPDIQGSTLESANLSEEEKQREIAEMEAELAELGVSQAEIDALNTPPVNLPTPEEQIRQAQARTDQTIQEAQRNLGIENDLSFEGAKENVEAFINKLEVSGDLTEEELENKFSQEEVQEFEKSFELLEKSVPGLEDFNELLKKTFPERIRDDSFDPQGDEAVEDKNINQPTLSTTPTGSAQIHVPPSLFEIWKTSVVANEAEGTSEITSSLKKVYETILKYSVKPTGQTVQQGSEVNP